MPEEKTVAQRFAEKANQINLAKIAREKESAEESYNKILNLIEEESQKGEYKLALPPNCNPSSFLRERICSDGFDLTCFDKVWIISWQNK